MNNTPETDIVASHDGNWGTKALRMMHHARKLERDLGELRKAIRKASNDFNKLAWGSDGNLGADRIIESLEDLLPENQ